MLSLNEFHHKEKWFLIAASCFDLVSARELHISPECENRHQIENTCKQIKYTYGYVHTYMYVSQLVYCILMRYTHYNKSYFYHLLSQSVELYLSLYLARSAALLLCCSTVLLLSHNSLLAPASLSTSNVYKRSVFEYKSCRPASVHQQLKAWSFCGEREGEAQQIICKYKYKTQLNIIICCLLICYT